METRIMKNISTPTASSVYFQVFDGQYVSDLFEDLDEAIADGTECATDENFSGNAEVVQFALCDGGDAGTVVWAMADLPRRMEAPSRRMSHAVRALYTEHSARLNRTGGR